MTSDPIDLLLSSPVSFLSDSGPDDDIAISTRIRLARNLAGKKFPDCADDDLLRKICGEVLQAAQTGGAFGCPECFRFVPEEMTLLDREVLFERRLASRDFLKRPHGTLLLVRSDESASAMVNEEDHLRLQVLRPGFQLGPVWREISRIDDELSDHLEYAFDERLGFLTACPTNVGTGIRASVMLHLPGLTLSGEIAATVQGINKLGLAVRGITGEGSENRGNLFQISNQSTLGESEKTILQQLGEVISKLIEAEKSARLRLVKKDQYQVMDWIGRSLGTLRYAYKLSHNEAVDALSGVRLGVDLGIFRKIDLHLVNELFRVIGPAHLQKGAGKELSGEEQEICRAALFRERLAFL